MVSNGFHIFYDIFTVNVLKTTIKFLSMLLLLLLAGRKSNHFLAAQDVDSPPLILILYIVAGF